MTPFQKGQSALMRQKTILCKSFWITMASLRVKQMRAAQISSAWKTAIQQETVVQAQDSAQSATRPFAGAMPAVVVANKAPVLSISKTTRLGAFATAADGQGSLTYYFSVSDPESAKMSANLNTIYRSGKSKYKFTCVDLTPLSDKFQASPANRGSLPCDWRMPKAGEVESLNIQQVPILVIQHPNAQPQQIAGVIEQQQLIELLR